MGSVSVDTLKDVVLEWESYDFGCRFGLGLGLGLGFELNSVSLRMATDLNAGIVVLNPSHFPTGGTVDLFDDHEHPRRLEWNRNVRYLLSVDLNISTAEVGVGNTLGCQGPRGVLSHASRLLLFSALRLTDSLSHTHELKILFWV